MARWHAVEATSRAQLASSAALGVFADVRDRDLRGTHDGFLVEGRTTLEVALSQGRFPLTTVLVSQRARARVEPLVADAELDVYVAPQRVMDELVGFPIHRGILAFGRRRAASVTDLVQALPSHSVVLMLCGLTNHDNVGACFRNAAALGADAVLLDARCCDPLYRKAIRVSAGQTLVLPWARVASDTTALLASLRESGFHAVGLALDDRAIPIGVLESTQRQLLVVGTEGPGLSEQVKRACDQLAVVPMRANVDSLNVATAAAIALYALGEGS